MKYLRKLHLTENNIFGEGTAKTGKNKSWLSLEGLWLNDRLIGDKAIVIIAIFTIWKNLTKLCLSANNFGEKVTWV